MANNDIPVGSLKPRVSGNGPTEEKKKKEITPVATGDIKKKSLREKFTESFVKEDMKSVGETLVKEKIFPELMGLIIDTISDALSMHFGLGSRRSSVNRPGYTNYASVSNYAYSYNGNKGNGVNSYGKEQQAPKKETVGDYRSIRYFSKDDADKVLYSLKCYADEYSQANVSVADLYSFSNLSSNSFTDNNYGWTLNMLENVKAVMVREDGENKWYLTLPNPVPID